MKIVVISDTHGDFYSIKKVAMIENGADVYLHAGDVEAFGNEDISPFCAVKGNCDYGFSHFRSEYTLNTNYGKLYMRHYPIFDETHLKELYDKGIRIFIHGHTHVKERKKYKDMYILCPGSLSKPRDGSPSYMLIETSEKKVEIIFKSI